jgi:hypothetical protein
MSCACCEIDYADLEERIESGEIVDLDRALRELADQDLYVSDGMLIYCPSCREAIAGLRARMAAQLRRETLASLPDLLDRAYEERKRRRAWGE